MVLLLPPPSMSPRSSPLLRFALTRARTRTYTHTYLQERHGNEKDAACLFGPHSHARASMAYGALFANKVGMCNKNIMKTYPFFFWSSKFAAPPRHSFSKTSIPEHKKCARTAPKNIHTHTPTAIRLGECSLLLLFCTCTTCNHRWYH